MSVPNIENQAVWCDGKGQPFRIGPAPMYSPQADEVVIRNHAIAINPIDWKIQELGKFIKTWPTILGCDIAGEVVEVGQNVKTFQKGDRVLACADSVWPDNSNYGGFQLYTVAPASLTAKIPDQMSFQDASTFPTAIETATTALFSGYDKGLGNPRPGDGRGLALPQPSMNPRPSGKSIVIWGGSSSVGSTATQLAVSAGVKVVAVASSRNHDLCRQCGASAVVDYNSPTAVEDVVEVVKTIGGEFSGVLDAISTVDGSLKFTPHVVDQLRGGLLIGTRPMPDVLPKSVNGYMIQGGSNLTHAVWRDFVPEALAGGALRCLLPAYIVGCGLGAVQKAVEECKKGVSGKKLVVLLE